MAKNEWSLKHDCQLDVEKLPILSQPAPFAPWWTTKLPYKWRKLTIISRKMPLSREFFRSSSAIFAEKQRQLQNPAYRFSIHPFSRLTIVYRVLTVSLWITLLIICPLQATYLSNLIQVEFVDYDALLVSALLNLLSLSTVVINFYIGYPSSCDKEVVLELDKIGKKYLKSYFLIDFLPILYGLTLLGVYSTPVYQKLLTCPLYFLRILRLRTLVEYQASILHYFNIRQVIVKIVHLVVLTIIYLHTWTCLIYLVIGVNYYLTQSVNDSHIIRKAVGTNSTVYYIYTENFLSVLCHAMGTSKCTFNPINPLERLLIAFLTFSGIIFSTYSLSEFLLLSATMRASEAKFSEMLLQLDNYMVNRQFSDNLTKKITKYYTFRFQGKYFDEDIILKSLSEHLRCEVKLYSTRNIINKMELFQGLSRQAIGTLLSVMKHDVFLPGDRINRSNYLYEYIYFISYGTVAVYAPNGRELFHLEDGHHFGDFRAVFKKFKRSPTTEIVIETCEMFYVKYKDFVHIVEFFPDVKTRVYRLADEKMQTLESILSRSVSGIIMGNELLQKLREKKILDQRIKRYW